ncbi:MULTISPECIES: hypothetical protein [unclassified Streptomyces]|uniref:hypothetical protein n=1 Tax=unclassified Streptomyces TaxID=2593676 RepID=UPI0032482B63
MGAPSRQTVNSVGGRERAGDVRVGDRLWTLDGDRTVRTTVVGVSAVKARDAVDVVTGRTRGTFRPEQHAVRPVESTWVEVGEVRERTAAAKPFTFYSYRLDPYPTFLINGHLVRQMW